MDEKREAYELGSLEAMKNEIKELKGVVKALLKWLILNQLREEIHIHMKDLSQTYRKLYPYMAKAQEELLREGLIWIDKEGFLRLSEEEEEK